MRLDVAKVDKIIYEWVRRNYGESEAQDPSWSIINLAHEIVDKYGEVKWHMDILPQRYLLW